MPNALKEGLCVGCNITPIINRPDGKDQLPLCSACREKIEAKVRMMRVSGKSRQKKMKIIGGYMPPVTEVEA